MLTDFYSFYKMCASLKQTHTKIKKCNLHLPYTIRKVKGN